MIEVLAGGPLSTIQDRGRIGLRRIGVPRAGVLVPAWMTIANVLVGNRPEAPVIECFEGGLRLRVGAESLLVAHVGRAEVVLVSDGVRRPLAPWRGHRLPPGAEIALRDTGAARLAVLAIRGLDIPSRLGSASTYAKAALGGIDGRALASGDWLPLAGDPDAPELACEPFGAPSGASTAALAREREHRSVPAESSDRASREDESTPVLRAVPGPQHEAFEEKTIGAFFDTVWTLSAEADRMGARLEGPALEHRDASARDIVSDAIVPGSVQVPGSGQPIVMLADAHTAGGYPKIATVLSADLPLLALHRPGTRFRLARVGVEEGIAVAREAARALAEHIGSVRPAPATRPDTARLLAHNLVDGVTGGDPDAEE